MIEQEELNTMVKELIEELSLINSRARVIAQLGDTVGWIGSDKKASFKTHRKWTIEFNRKKNVNEESVSLSIEVNTAELKTIQEIRAHIKDELSKAL